MIYERDEEEIKPYDEYEDIKGSTLQEYMSMVERIKRNKENYRKRRELPEIFKLKHIGKDYD